MAIRLLITEDHPWVRRGLRATFEDTEIEIAGEATTVEQAVRMALAGEADVMLLDLKLPDGDGFEILQKVKSEKSDLPVVIYSQYERSDFQVRARNLGANGYLVKRADADELIGAVRRVSQGESLWCERVV